MPRTVGVQNQGINAERRDIDVAEYDLDVNLLSLSRNKDLYELFECYVHIHSLTLPEDPESGIHFYADILIFLRNGGFIL